MGEDWREEFFLERVEFEGILAVNFVIYGILGRGLVGVRDWIVWGRGLRTISETRSLMCL
jgi:hypothetical protein